MGPPAALPSRGHGPILAVRGPSILDPQRFTERGAIWALLVGLTFAGDGCKSNECALEQVRCNGKLAQQCGTAGSDDPTLVWFTENCGTGYCHLSSDSANPAPFCAATVEPDPSCAGSAGANRWRYCDGNQVKTCHQGYLVCTIDCATGVLTGERQYALTPATGYCVALSTGAECVAEPTPNPLCATLPASSGSLCDGGSLRVCHEGYLSTSYACPATGACVSTPVPFCSASPAPDPSCTGAASYYSVCKDGQITYCQYAYPQGQDACPAGTTCAMVNGEPLCSN